MRLLAGVCVVAMGLAGVGGPAAEGFGVRTVRGKGDGPTKGTAGIQKAIGACAGGGTVKLGGGTFVSGPIVLKSNITLDVEKGATLLGSPDRADFPPATFARNKTVQPFVSAPNAENVTITGGGTID